MTPELKALLVRRTVLLAVIGLVTALFPIGLSAALPVGCVSCHQRSGIVANVTSQAHSEEAGVCETCHIGDSLADRARFALYQGYGMYLPVLRVSDSPISMVSDDICISCHDEMRGVIAVYGLRIRHETCTVGSRCTDCHANTAHLDELAWPTTYSMNSCLECHDTREVRESCETCHTGRLTAQRPTTGSWSSTHGPGWRSTHGMGDMPTCASCHPDNYCQRCHGSGVPHDERFYGQHGRFSLAADAQCTACHATVFCDECHGTQMPHPVEFTREHNSTVEADGEDLCRECHATDDCTLCHEQHDAHPDVSDVSMRNGSRP